MPGRPRTPTKVLAMRGSFKPHPERKKERENEPQGDIISADTKPPRGFTAKERAVWKEFVSDAPFGMFEKSDLHILTITVRLMTEFNLKGPDLAQPKMTALLRGLQQLGKTPIERSKVVVRNRPDKKDGWDDA